MLWVWFLLWLGLVFHGLRLALQMLSLPALCDDRAIMLTCKIVSLREKIALHVLKAVFLEGQLRRKAWFCWAMLHLKMNATLQPFVSKPKKQRITILNIRITVLNSVLNSPKLSPKHHNYSRNTNADKTHGFRLLGIIFYAVRSDFLAFRTVFLSI